MQKNLLFQNTLKNKIFFSGTGLFTGEKVSITIHPAKEDHGIIFKRTDFLETIILPASLEYVKEADRTTSVGEGKKGIQTVEHLLSALAAYNIDNALIEIDGPEVPIRDGSAKHFVEFIEKAGIKKQSKLAKIYTIDEIIHFSYKHTHLIAIPSNEYRISFTLHHPSNDFLRSQYLSFSVNEKDYKSQISPSRTYSIYEEIKPLLDNNFFKGGSLNNSVVIKEGKVVNSDGMRFSDEMVRHKVLDLIGDMSLIGNRFLMHIIAIRSGHLTNIKFAKKLKKYLKQCEIHEHEKKCIRSQANS